MPHFKDLSNTLYFLTDQDVANGWIARLPVGRVQITDAEADAIRQASVIVPVPQRVDSWQMAQALIVLGLIEAVEAAVAESTDPFIKYGWQKALYFVRTDPLVVSMGHALGKTEAEMDALFSLAASL